jgi:hypothetical protein
MTALVLHSPGILRREDFGVLCNLRGLRGRAVEIGTHLGEFAAAFLDQWQGERLFCVDPWRNKLPGYVDPCADRDREADLEEATRRLSRFGDRVQFLRMLSSDAAPGFAAGSVDFCYVDANHAYASVVEDLGLWWPKVKTGGVLAGHDWASDYVDTVQRAVREFFASGVPPVYVLPGDAWSWYAVKP